MSVTNFPFVQEEMVRYGMSIYFSLGLLGNIFSCIMFTRSFYRRSPSSIYFLSLSSFSIIYLFWTILPFFYTLDHINPQIQFLIYCKLRLYGTHVIGQCIRYILVCACADRYFVTRTNVRIRSLNSNLIAVKLIFIICPVWLVIGIHMPILMDIKGNVCGMCAIYKLVYAIYQNIVVSVLPLVLMSIFSILTIGSLHHRHGNQARAKRRDRDFMCMTIAEVIIHIFTSIPYSFYLVYSAVTYYAVDKSAQRLEIEAFLFFLTQFIIYLTSSVSFYLFILTSKPFRNEFIITNVKFWNKYILRRVSVLPQHEQNIPVTITVRVGHIINNNKTL